MCLTLRRVQLSTRVFLTAVAAGLFAVSTAAGGETISAQAGPWDAPATWTEGPPDQRSDVFITTGPITLTNLEASTALLFLGPSDVAESTSDVVPALTLVGSALHARGTICVACTIDSGPADVAARVVVDAGSLLTTTDALELQSNAELVINISGPTRTTAATIGATDTFGAIDARSAALAGALTVSFDPNAAPSAFNDVMTLDLVRSTVPVHGAFDQIHVENVPLGKAATVDVSEGGTALQVSLMPTDLFVWSEALSAAGNEIVEVDVNTGTSISRILPDTSVFIDEVEYGFGAFYAASLDPSDPLRVLGPLDGRLLRELPLTYPPTLENQVITALEFVDGTLYAGLSGPGDSIEFSQLATVDLGTGLITEVGQTGVIGPLGSLTRRDGVTYAITTPPAGPSTLYTIDLASGAADAIARTIEVGTNATVNLTAIAFAGDRKLYGTGTVDGSEVSLFQVDVETADTTRVGPLTGLNSATALTFAPDRNPCNLNNASFEAGDFTDWTTQDLEVAFVALSVRETGTVDPTGGLVGFDLAATDGLFAASHGFDGTGATTGSPITIAQEFVVVDPAITFDHRTAWDLMFMGIPANLDRTFDVVLFDRFQGIEILRTNVQTFAAGTSGDTGLVSSVVDVSTAIGQQLELRLEWSVPEDFTGPALVEIDNLCNRPAPFPGDMNCDEALNADDIDPFVLAVLSAADYRGQFPECNFDNADINLDGEVNSSDIGPFVDLLLAE